MNVNYLGVIVFGIFAMSVIFIFTTEGYGRQLATNAVIYKIDSLNISDLSAYDIVRVNLKAAGAITNPAITFSTTVPAGKSVNIFFYDDNGILIGTGTQVLGGSATTVTISPMSDTVTAVERATLATVTVTVT